MSAESSTCTLAFELSFAAKALNMVAFVKFPFESVIRSVLPCSEKETFTVSISRSVYSPRPLNVYLFPSSVVMWGSPKNIANNKEYISKICVDLGLKLDIFQYEQIKMKLNDSINDQELVHLEALPSV